MTELQIINTAATSLLAVLGACVASFINVVALRRAEGISWISGRSHCPACGKALAWFELIPVVSWLFLLGRCRACKARIPPRYALVELAGAASSAFCYIRYGLTWMTVLSFGVSVILLTITMIDLTSMEIPNALIIALIPFAVWAIWAMPDVSLLSRGIGMFTASVPMLILALIVAGAFGGGDVKLMAVCGVLLGWENTLLALFIAILTGGVLSISLMLTGRAKKGAHIAFGPHLCAGVMVALLYGKELISWYLGLFGL